MSHTPIIQLKNLGPKSASALEGIGIETIEQLRKVGPLRAYVQLGQDSDTAARSLNMLWAMIAGLEDRHWTSLSKSEKADYIMQLEDMRRFDAAEL